MFEAERREKERQNTEKKLQQYEEEHAKRTGGSQLKLLDTKDFVRNFKFFSSHRCIDLTILLQKDPEDPDFFQPGAHESKIEEMLEIAYIISNYTRIVA